MKPPSAAEATRRAAYAKALKIAKTVEPAFQAGAVAELEATLEGK